MKIGYSQLRINKLEWCKHKDSDGTTSAYHWTKLSSKMVAQKNHGLIHTTSVILLTKLQCGCTSEFSFLGRFPHIDDNDNTCITP